MIVLNYSTSQISQLSYVAVDVYLFSSKTSGVKWYASIVFFSDVFKTKKWRKYNFDNQQEVVWFIYTHNCTIQTEFEIEFEIHYFELVIVLWGHTKDYFSYN